MTFTEFRQSAALNVDFDMTQRRYAPSPQMRFGFASLPLGN
jgi:hypothetical protein